MDHGILNVPLSKRGDIDKQIDKYKDRYNAERAMRHKLCTAVVRAQRAQAKQMVAELADERAAALMQSHQLTRKQLLTKLNSIAHWTPAVILRGI